MTISASAQRIGPRTIARFASRIEDRLSLAHCDATCRNAMRAGAMAGCNIVKTNYEMERRWLRGRTSFLAAAMCAAWKARCVQIATGKYFSKRSNRRFGNDMF